VIHRAIAIPGVREGATTGGVTWYATRWTRLQVNLVREQLRGALPQPAPPSRVWSRLISLQVVI
jgi:hypothetical protein